MSIPSAPPPPSDAARLGRYRMESLVARGGMGEIWRGEDLEAGQPVAIKRLLLREGELTADELRARLVRETRLLQGLNHENIVRYLDAGLDPQGQPYLVLEWLEGEDVATRQQRAPLSLDEVLEVTRQALRGLAACHARGVVHRDVKPGNLFLVPRGQGFTVKVLDLGLARPGTEATRLTMAGTVLGTLHYLSPEQARGAQDVDFRADLYAVGVILYQLCTGRLPFPGDQAVTVLLKIVTETPPRPRQLCPDLPSWLDEVIVRAIQRAPSERFGSAEEMSAALAPKVALLPAPTVEDRELSGGPDETVAVSRPTSSGEYRMVCLLCAQLADGAARGLQQIAADVTAAGGAFHALLGEQAVGIFGLDRTQGDEGLRAVRAAQHARGTLGRAVRLLVATTHVRVRQGLRFEGSDLDRVVAELPALPPGEVVLDSGTRQLLGPRVELKRVGTHDVVLSLAAEEPRRQVLGVQTPTVGRETELATLRAAFNRTVENSEAEGLLLSGPLGVGKSRLVHELLPELRPRCALCLVARADSSRMKTSYGLFAAAVSRAAGVHAGQSTDTQRHALAAFIALHAETASPRETALFIGATMGVVMDATPALLAARSDPRVMREGVAAAFESLLATAAAKGPIALCLEDLQWADEESLQLCEALLERLEHLPLFLLVTARPELKERRPATFEKVVATTVEVPPLRRRALRRLIRALLGQRVASDLEERIALWSEGNPYLAEELLSWLVTCEALVLTEAGWDLRAGGEELELPAGVEGAIQGRLDRLDSQLKDLLKAASVFGEVFWEKACVAIGFADGPELLRELEAAQFVIRCGDSRIDGTAEWAFRHPLLQQVAYGMLPLEVGAPLPLRAAHLLEEAGEKDAAWLAYPLYEGGDLQRAAAFSARAGSRALVDGDLERAAEHYSASLIEPLTPQEQAERRMGLARALIPLARYDEAWQALDELEAAQQNLDEVWAARAAFLRGRIRLSQGSSAEAEKLLAGAAEIAARCPDSELLFDARHSLFWVIWVQGRYADAGRMAEQLFEEAKQGNRPDHLCSAKLALAYAQVISGDHCAAIRLAQEAVEHAQQVRHPFREVDALMLLGSAQEIVGLYEAAARSVRTALDLATRLKTVFSQASAHGCMGRIELARDEVKPAVDHFTRSIDLAESIGESRTLAVSLAGQARALLHSGRRADQQLAAISAQRAVELAEKRAPPVEAEALMAQSQVSLAEGEAEEAVEHALAAVTLLERMGTQERYELEILLTAHDALVAAGRTDESAEILRRAERTLGRQLEKIRDPRLRRSFTERVPHNRRVLELAARLSR